MYSRHFEIQNIHNNQKNRFLYFIMVRGKGIMTKQFKIFMSKDSNLKIKIDLFEDIHKNITKLNYAFYSEIYGHSV